MAPELRSFTDLLAQIVDNRGKTCPTASSGVPLIATNCVRNDLLYPAYENVRYVSNDTFETWFRGHPLPGDLIFVTKGSPGRVCVAPDPVDFCIAQDMVALRADETKIYPRYLFAVLRSPAIQERISQLHVGTLIPHFKKGDFGKLLIPVPTPALQREIGDIYFILSAKIELNRRMNETLEAIAQSVFTSWFAEDSARSHRVGFGEVIDFQEGPGIMAVDFRSEGVPLIRLAGLIDGVSLLTGCNFLEPEMVKRKWSHFALRCGDVLLSTSASLGRVATVTNEAAGAIAYTGIIRMRPRGDLTVPEIIRMILLSRDFQEQVEAVGAGSVLRHFGPTHLRSMKLTMPEIAKQYAFAEVIRPIFAKQTANLREIATLVSLRDTLLPKLLSGEIRVGVAEKEVAEVV